jgi:hypothetical protein
VFDSGANLALARLKKRALADSTERSRPSWSGFQRVWPPFASRHRTKTLRQTGNLPQQPRAHPLAGAANFRPQRRADGDLAGSAHAHFRQRDQQQGERIAGDQRLPDEFHRNGRHVAVLARTRVEARRRNGFGLPHPVSIGVDAGRSRFGQVSAVVPISAGATPCAEYFLTCELSLLVEIYDITLMNTRDMMTSSRLQKKLSICSSPKFLGTGHELNIKIRLSRQSHGARIMEKELPLAKKNSVLMPRHIKNSSGTSNCRKSLGRQTSETTTPNLTIPWQLW